LRQSNFRPTLSFTIMQPASVLSTSTSEEHEQSAAGDLAHLSRSLRAMPQLDSESAGVVPPVPETLEETGLTASTMQLD
jgi:hypothetical protein